MSDASPKPRPQGTRDTHELGALSQWQLIGRRFAKHKVARFSFYIVGILYFIAIFAEFMAPTDQDWRDLDFAFCPPQIPKFNLVNGWHANRLVREIDPITLKKYYILRESEVVPLGFFVSGEPYRLWGLIPMRRHFFGVDTNRHDGAFTPRFYFFWGRQIRP